MTQRRLPPEVNRILFVRNLPYKLTAEDLYDLFGKYGCVCPRGVISVVSHAHMYNRAIRQIRIGSASDNKGTAYVVYEDIYDAKTACDHLSGFNVLGRYLVCLYHNPGRVAAAAASRNASATNGTS